MAHGLQNNAHGANWRRESPPSLGKFYQNTPLLTLQQRQTPIKLIANRPAKKEVLSSRVSEDATKVHVSKQEELSRITGGVGIDMVEISVDETTRAPNGKLPKGASGGRA
jgi:hypothetical protein